MFRIARYRLVAWNVLVFSAILVVLGIIVYGVFYSQVYSSVDQQLKAQDARLEVYLFSNAGNLRVLEAPPNNLLDPAVRTVITNSAGQVNWTSDCPDSTYFPNNCSQDDMTPISADSIRQVLLSGKPDVRSTTFQKEPYRVRTFPMIIAGSLLVVQTSRIVQGEEGALNEVRDVLIGGTILGIILAAMGSLFLANRALIPIRQAFARQRRFTADASHELRTPLALIRANAEMLDRHGEQLPPEDSELITEIIRETDHLNRLVGDLLTLARADSESTAIVTRPVDLRDLITEVHEDLHLIAESRGIESAVSVNGPVVVSGDEGRLRQLLLILLDNALKYTDPGGRVELSLRGSDHHARLVVADTGIGIPTADLPHIFERFYRVDRAREHESGGTGLGLAIAQWIVQAHRGTIKAESQVGKGTSFQIELPT